MPAMNDDQSSSLLRISFTTASLQQASTADKGCCVKQIHGGVKQTEPGQDQCMRRPKLPTACWQPTHVPNSCYLVHAAECVSRMVPIMTNTSMWNAHIPQVVCCNCLCFLAGYRPPFGGMLKPLCVYIRTHKHQHAVGKAFCHDMTV
jgi:hypothetical protein